MATKPVVNTNSTYNLNGLPSDRRFEELLHRIFQYRIKDDLKGDFDDALLMPGVAEKGVDISLKLKGKNNGAVQCKMNTSGTLNKPAAAKEIIKFVLYYLQDNELINDIDTFQYYLVASGKFASTSITLLGDFKNKILREPDLQKWTEAVLKEYSAFKSITYKSVEKDLKSALSKLNVKQRSYSEINGWLSKYPEIVSEFFEVKKVIESAGVEKKLNNIIGIINPDLEAKAQKLISDYYKSAKAHLDSVKFIGHDIQQGNRPRNITVSKLYIEPYFKERRNITSDEEDAEVQKELRIQDVFQRPNNYIILGDPGAGKSLTVKSLILRFIKNRANVGGLKTCKEHIPFRIELRKYNELKAKGTINILSYLTTLLKSEYQLNDVEEKVLEYIIQNKPTLFFFDGLDEIFDVGQKNIVRDDIVNFINVNLKVKGIVTSRFRGYHDISFPEDIFSEFEIQNFDNEQVDKFIGKFYATQISNRKQREIEIESCKNQLRNVDRKLKTNPLILSLMSLLAINKIVIPDSKLDVYRSITNTLVETRDKDEKNLKIKLKVKSKRATLGHLAYWQYCQMTNQKKIGRKLAEKAIANYLIQLKSDPINDEYEATEAANDFLDYAERRSIYFDDNFTHKTFLEYYTADYIFTRFHNSWKHSKRDEIISQHIKNSSWHIVFELLIAMIDEGLVESDALDELIMTHMDMNDPTCMHFLIGLLGGVDNIGEQVKEKIIAGTIHLLIQLDGEETNENKGTYTKGSLFRPLSQLNRIVEIKNLIQKILFDFEEMQLAVSERINLYILIEELSLVDWDEVEEQYITYEEGAKINDYKNDSLVLFIHHCLRDKEDRRKDIVSILYQQVEVFGIETIFKGIPYKFQKGVGKIATFYIFLRYNDYSSQNKLKQELEYLESVGVTLDTLKKHNAKFRYLSKEELEKAISLFLVVEDKIVNDFLELLLFGMEKKSLSSFREYMKHSKFAKLVESIPERKRKPL